MIRPAVYFSVRFFALAVVLAGLLSACTKMPYLIDGEKVGGTPIKLGRLLIQSTVGQIADMPPGAEIARFNRMLAVTFTNQIRERLEKASVRVMPERNALLDATLEVTHAKVLTNRPGAFVGRFQVTLVQEPLRTLLWQGEFTAMGLGSVNAHAEAGKDLAEGIATRLTELGYLR